jgi:Na+-translocating ferredoxin:NAD+ oxidoreductase RnfE subunit
MYKHPPAQQQQLCLQQLLKTNMQLHQLLHFCPSAVKLHSSAASQLGKASYLHAAAHQSCMSAFMIIVPGMHGMLHE